MRKYIDDFGEFKKKFEKVHVIITFNFTDNNLRDRFIKDITGEDYKLNRERDQSTLCGTLDVQRFNDLKVFIKNNYIDDEDCVKTDFVDIYSTESKISKDSLEK